MWWCHEFPRRTHACTCRNTNNRSNTLYSIKPGPLSTALWSVLENKARTPITESQSHQSCSSSSEGHGRRISTHSHTLLLTHTHTHTCAHTHRHSHSDAHTHMRSHTDTHTQTLTHTLTQTLTQTLTHSSDVFQQNTAGEKRWYSLLYRA